MRKEIQNAKDEGLNWQALEIEDAETRIKLIIRDAIIRRLSWRVVEMQINKIFEEITIDFENVELAEKTIAGLKRFASERYLRLRNSAIALNLGILGAVTAYLYGKEKERAEAQRLILKDVPELRAVPYREIAQPLKEYSVRYMKRVEETFNYLAEATAKEYDSPVSLRNIAEMTVRYERHEEELRELRESGVNLVWTSTHANCSERCQPWQGKLYSLDGTYGAIDGIRYQPLENATDIYYTTKRGKTYKNGIISGFNCRHFLIPYKKGNKPIHVDAKTIDKQREIDKQQRYLERGVRSYRDKAVVFKGVDNRLYRRYKAKAKEWNARYIAYSRENKAAYYPSRTQIFD